MKQLKKLSLTLALLITAVGGAWAQYEFSSDPYTSTTEFNSVSVTSSMTLNINEGVIVTVNSGLTIEDGVTLTLTGGGRLSVFGKSGNWGRDASYEEGTLIYEATAGGDGEPAIILNDNAKIVIDNGEIYAEGGQGGRGGEDATAGINKPDGAAGNAFSRFPTIDGATLYYKSSNEWFKYTSGDKTLYREMKAVPPTFEVTLNDPKTEASFEMPTYDVDVDYELVRDMSVSMTTKIGDGNDGYRIRLKKSEQDPSKYEPAEMTAQQMMALVKVHDAIENQDLTFGVQDANCIVNIYAANENNEATGDPIAFPDLTPGRYIAKAVAATGSAYEGETGMSNIFELYEGYQVVIPAGEYVTYYKDEAVRLEEKDKNDIELCTITAVEDGKAVLSDNFDAMKASTPFLLKNTTNEEKTILLIPCNEPDLAVTVANEFIGTLTAKEFTEDDMATGDFYVCNGKEFIKVRGAGTLAPNKAYLKVTGNAPASIPFRRSIDGGEGTTGISEEVRVKSEEFATAPYYDLNGRKLQGKPTQKGVYIQNGKKVVVK